MAVQQCMNYGASAVMGLLQPLCYLLDGAVCCCALPTRCTQCCSVHGPRMHKVYPAHPLPPLCSCATGAPVQLLCEKKGPHGLFFFSFFFCPPPAGPLQLRDRSSCVPWEPEEREQLLSAAESLTSQAMEFYQPLDEEEGGGGGPAVGERSRRHAHTRMKRARAHAYTYRTHTHTHTTACPIYSTSSNHQHQHIPLNPTTGYTTPYPCTQTPPHPAS